MQSLQATGFKNRNTPGGEGTPVQKYKNFIVVIDTADFGKGKTLYNID